MHTWQRTLAAFMIACASIAQAADYAVIAIDVPLSPAQADGRWKIVDAKEIGAPPGTDLLWDVTLPPSKLFAVSENDEQMVFWLGKDPVEVRCDWVDFTKRKRGRIKVTYTAEPAPGPEPGPGPGPNPVPPNPDTRPEGLAGAIYDKAVLINRPDDCLRMAANFAAVEAGIANAKKFQSGDRNAPEPKYFTINQAMGAVALLNTQSQFDSAWMPFGEWIHVESMKNMATIDQVHAFFTATAKGLKAAGGKK